MLTFFSLVLTLAVPCLGRHVPYIIGGSTAPVGQWPWQGSLEVNRNHNCGCVLISTTWSVTAAHCVGYGANYYTVTYGLHDRFDWSSGLPTRYSFNFIKRHEYFVEGGNFPNDVAVAQHSSPVTLHRYVSTIVMAPRNKLYDGMACWITGWGVTTTGEGGQLARYLQQAEIYIIDKNTCNKYWNGVDRKHVCVGIMNTRGSCNGDSGGPLVCYVNDHYELVGVTSFGLVGCSPRRPSVYTSISYHRDWIQRHTEL